MAALSLSSPSSAAWSDDTSAVPAELVGRLYRASESAVLELTATFAPNDRANLAAYCYRKAHLHRIGLAIAATCDQSTLIQVFGTAVGQTLYNQSRDRPAAPERAPGAHRPKITLARLTPSAPIVPDADPDEVTIGEELECELALA
jgi:hypothetical protein